MEAHIDNYRIWVNESDAEILKKSLDELVTTAGFTILNFVEHHFEPQGYTALWLLAESHCALHTFPEHERAYIELSSCNPEMYEAFMTLLPRQFTVITDPA